MNYQNNLKNQEAFSLNLHLNQSYCEYSGIERYKAIWRAKSPR